MATLNNFENVLQHIHSNHIKQNAAETVRNNKILENVVIQLLNEMKKDPLFGILFNRIFYGGSYYDGLKVGQPEDFDLFLILKVPGLGSHTLEDLSEPGYLQMKFQDPELLSCEPFMKKFLVDTYYLSANKVQAWMESIFSKALNQFGSTWGGYNFRVGDAYFQGKRSETSSAMILQLQDSALSMKIHFVPCFELSNDQWPTAIYDRENIFQNKTFFIFPKSPEAAEGYPFERYWIPSFQEQERELLHDERNLKPTIKLLKRLRDVQVHKEVTSYCIKTIFLWEHMAHGDSYWNGTMTSVFFKMLEKYIVYIQSGTIRSYWNPSHNLLNISSARKENIVNRLRYIRNDLIEKQIVEPLVIGQYLGYSLGKGLFAFASEPAGRSWDFSNTSYNAPQRATPRSTSSVARTSTSTSQGFSTFTKVALGLGVGLAAVAGAMAYGMSSNQKDNDEDSD